MSATQHPAEEAVTEASKEGRNIWGCKAIRWYSLGARNVLESGCKTQSSGTEERSNCFSFLGNADISPHIFFVPRCVGKPK